MPCLFFFPKLKRHHHFRCKFLNNGIKYLRIEKSRQVRKKFKETKSGHISHGLKWNWTKNIVRSANVLNLIEEDWKHAVCRQRSEGDNFFELKGNIFMNRTSGKRGFLSCKFLW